MKLETVEKLLDLKARKQQVALVTELGSGAQDLFTAGHAAPALKLSPAAAEQVMPEGRAHLVAGTIPVGRLTVVEIGFQAVELLVENEVDHAGHGVRTVYGGSARGYDVDPLNQHLRNRIDAYRSVCDVDHDRLLRQHSKGVG